MFKIIKAPKLSIKPGDFLFDMNPEIHPFYAAGFEVIGFNTENNELVCKALNQMAGWYQSNEKNEFIFDLDSWEWFKLEVEV